jgi:hypothetical protein
MAGTNDGHSSRHAVAHAVTRYLHSERGRRRALYTVKGLHTVIFFVLGAGVLETVRAGITGRTTRATAPAIAATIGEGIVLAVNGNRCPLTDVAEELGADHGNVSDIFLPDWFARHIPTIATTLFGFGLGRLIEARSRSSSAQTKLR